jgi:hypothetical protein
MKITSLLTALGLATALLPLAAGCKSNKVQKAQVRSEKIRPGSSIDEVYKLMGKPRETFAAVYVWEYTISNRGTNRLFRVEFEERGGKWAVRSSEWR